MREHRVTAPEIIALAVTRGMLGFGAGLLLSSRVPRDRRLAIGVGLVLVGALSTIPLAIRLFRGRNDNRPAAPDARPADRAATRASKPAETHQTL